VRCPSPPVPPPPPSPTAPVVIEPYPGQDVIHTLSPPALRAWETLTRGAKESPESHSRGNTALFPPGYKYSLCSSVCMNEKVSEKNVFVV
jgi:hypothetical protein